LKRIMIWSAGVIVAALSAIPALSAPVTLTFEGLADQATVGGFYDGGLGGDLGVSFSGDAIALVDSDAGGSLDLIGIPINGIPSPPTVLAFSGRNATLTYAAGFTKLSLFYFVDQSANNIRVFDGPDGAGNVLAELFLDVTTGSGSPFKKVDITFTGVARSIDFSNVSSTYFYDNITLAPIPVPGALPLMVSGLAAFGLVRRRARR
jgi:hypothetical protein